MSRLALVCALVGIPALVWAEPHRSPDVETVLTLRGLVGTPRYEQEQILVNLIASTPDSEVEEKTEYLFRLGELYAAEVRTFRAAGHAERAKGALVKAVKTFAVLTENVAFRNAPRLESALFEYGYMLQTANYPKEARAAYDKLLENYPQSSLVPEVYVAFAELHAQLGQLAEAEARYQYALRFPTSGVFAYALDRIGWLQHEQQRDQEASESFAKVIALTKDEPAQAAILADARQGYGETAPALLWQRAEAAPKQPERWVAAADAYFAVAAAATDPQRVHEAATRSVQAWQSALAIDPRAMAQAGVVDLAAAARAKPRVIVVPTRETNLASAFALYERTLLDPDEIARTKLLRATLSRRHGDHAMAVTVLTDLLADHRDHETAERAANLLLDSLVRLRRYDEVLAIVDGFAADAAFLANKPVLQANIKFLRSRSLRR